MILINPGCGATSVGVSTFYASVLFDAKLEYFLPFRGGERFHPWWFWCLRRRTRAYNT